MPNSRGLDLEEIVTRERITQVARPGIDVFLTSKEENSGTSVLICPPGGYQKLTYILAGTQWAKWFNTIGINAFVLKYRLPVSADLIEREKGPLQDAQRAVRYIRAHADQFMLDPQKIGVAGSSSGGHQAALLATLKEDLAKIGDSLDSVSINIAFMILVSPVITMGQYAHQGSLKNLLGVNPTADLINKYSAEQNVDEKTATAFIVHAQNDNTVDPHNSLMFYQALLEKGRQATLHMFPSGGHSIGLRNNPGSTQYCTVLCEEWLKESGFIK